MEESVRALPAGTKVGVLKVRLYRPWGAAQFLDALPATVETIAVLERTDDAARQGQGAGAGGPLYQDILATTEDRRKGTRVIAPSVGGDDLTPVHVKSLVNALFAGARSAEVLSFTMAAAAAAAAAASSSSTGAAARPFQAVPADTTQVVVWGSGAVGSETMANDVLSNLRKTRRLQVQGRTAHDTVESEVAVTNHHLRFSSEPINAPYVVQPSTADLVAVFDTSALAAFNVLSSVARKGAVVLNCDWLKEASAADAADDAAGAKKKKGPNVPVEQQQAAVEANLPSHLRRQLAAKQARLFCLDAEAVAADITKEFTIGPITGSVGTEDVVALVMELAIYQLAATPGLVQHPNTIQAQSPVLMKAALQRRSSLANEEEEGRTLNHILEVVTVALQQHMAEVKYPAFKWSREGSAGARVLMPVVMDGGAYTSTAAPTLVAGCLSPYRRAAAGRGLGRGSSSAAISGGSAAADASSASSSTSSSSSGAHTLVGRTDAAWAVMFPEAHESEAHARPSDSLASTREEEDRTHLARLKTWRRLTSLDYDRNIFHIELDISGTGMTYKMGDALSVHPHNESSKVQDFLETCYPELATWAGSTTPPALLRFGQDSEAGTVTVMTAEQLCGQVIDLFGQPTKKFYKALAERSAVAVASGSHPGLADHATALAAIVADTAEGKALIAKRTEETTTFADLIAEFGGAALAAACLPLLELPALVGRIKPRLYSVASAATVHPTEVHLLVVAEDWTTPAGTYRVGLCSSYLERHHQCVDETRSPGRGDRSKPQSDELIVGTKASLMQMPADPKRPIMMAGTGTGMAPFRAFLQERERQHGEVGAENVGRSVLFFGARFSAKEFLYKEEMQAWEQSGVLTHLRLAWSRDQREKVYIQHKIGEDAALLWQLLHLEKGTFYLCGQKGRMPIDVHNAIKSGFVTAGGVSEEEAERMLQVMKEEGRYVIEVY